MIMLLSHENEQLEDKIPIMVTQLTERRITNLTISHKDHESYTEIKRWRLYRVHWGAIQYGLTVSSNKVSNISGAYMLAEK
jgi:hypothetical protein